ncbi:Coenzyme A disulfide reductase [uncultured Eubacterium sp.]|nr:Coenzyme A disulfide reductase [uncultured Eubacterium sp.]
MKVLIIGGVAGGATAAARLRRLNEEAEIIIFEKTGYVSYANCGLPYYIGGVIKNKKKLTLKTPEDFKDRFNIDVRVSSEVLSIDSKKKTLSVKNLQSGKTYTESYDKLILSPGAKAMKPELPGIDSEKIFTLRTVEDTFRIREYIEQQKPASAVVVGGGFIGLEMAENLLHENIQTTLLQRSGQVMPPLDYDMACQLHAYLRSKSLDLHLNSPIAGYEETEDGIKILLKDGSSLMTDMVLLAIGVTPDTHLAKDAGLTLGIKDAIAVNEHLQTSDSDIYAVGDAIEVTHFVSGVKTVIPLAGPANKQGRIAADNICGRLSTYKGSQGSSIIKLFDMTCASTGLNEKTAKAAGIKYDKVINFSPSHATYYPGAGDMTIKTLYDPEDGRILGAQIVGFDGVDKRIDVLATAIRGKMTGYDLAELELAYAPPFSSAKDPVNMVGFVIENILEGRVSQYHWQAIPDLTKDETVTCLDVRTTGEFEESPLENALNIPLDSLRENLHLLEKEKPVYVNCYSGLRSYVACRILSELGYRCYNLSGGYGFYEYILYDKSFDETARHGCGVKI